MTVLSICSYETLFDLADSADFLKGGNDLLGVFLGDAFLDGGGSAIDHSLGFLEAQTSLLADDLDLPEP